MSESIHWVDGTVAVEKAEAVFFCYIADSLKLQALLDGMACADR
jgi:hypothetical protein